MTLRRNSHWQPEVTKQHLVDDINEWLRAAVQLKDAELKSPDSIRMVDLRLICHAIEALAAREVKP